MGRIQLFAYSLVLGLTACGGGGGGGDGGGSASSVTPPPPQTPLVYSGATTAATVSSNNAGTVASNVIGATGATGGGPVVAVSALADPAPASAPQPTGATGLMRRLTQALHGSDLASKSSGALAGVAVDQTVPCDSGSMRISGDRAADGTGTLSVSYNACRSGTDTINGPASLQVASYDQTNRVITDGTFSFTRVSFTGPGINSDLTGTLRTQVAATPNFMDAGAATETITLNIITQDKGSGGRMTRTQNLRIVNVYSSMTSPTFYNQSIDGRVFDSVAGFVDVTTNTLPFTAPWGPLYYSNLGQSFPDWGEIV